MWLYFMTVNLELVTCCIFTARGKCEKHRTTQLIFRLSCEGFLPKTFNTENGRKELNTNVALYSFLP